MAVEGGREKEQLSKQAEGDFHDEARAAVLELGSRLFRNNNGVAIYRGPDGKETGRVRYGLGPGTSDLIGWTPVVITEDMVGETLAVFTAMEGKRGKDKLRKDQKAFIAAVNQSGGIAGTYGAAEGAADRIEDRVRELRHEENEG